MSNYYGSIDLTKLGDIVRKHPELVRKVQMRDGSEHQFLNIDINEKREIDQWGNAAYVKASCKKAEQREGVNYYLCDLKESQNQYTQQPTAPTAFPPQQAFPPVQQPQQPTQQAQSNNDLPF